MDKNLLRGIAKKYRETVDSFIAFQKNCRALVDYAEMMVGNRERYEIRSSLTRDLTLVFVFKDRSGSLVVPAAKFCEEFLRNGPVSRKALKRIAIGTQKPEGQGEINNGTVQDH